MKHITLNPCMVDIFKVGKFYAVYQLIQPNRLLHICCGEPDDYKDFYPFELKLLFSYNKTDGEYMECSFHTGHIVNFTDIVYELNEDEVHKYVTLNLL